jgi:hypothetical protein
LNCIITAVSDVCSEHRGRQKKTCKTAEDLIKELYNSLQIMIDQKTGECGFFNYLDSMLTSDGRCTCEIKSRIAMVTAAFNNKRALFTSKRDLDLRKKLVKCYIWSIALYGAETWTLRSVDLKHLENFEMWCWRLMEMNKNYLESRSRGISYMK